MTQLNIFKALGSSCFSSNKSNLVVLSTVLSTRYFQQLLSLNNYYWLVGSFIAVSQLQGNFPRNVKNFRRETNLTTNVRKILISRHILQLDEYPLLHFIDPVYSKWLMILRFLPIQHNTSVLSAQPSTYSIFSPFSADTTLDKKLKVKYADTSSSFAIVRFILDIQGLTF